MPSWTGKGRWRKWSGRLAVSDEGGFPRKSLPFLRLFWPNAEPFPETRGHKGADIVAWNEESGNFSCAIRCLGFRNRDLGREEIGIAEEAIQNFRDSNISTSLYLLIHNQDARSREFHHRIQGKLEELLSAGRVKEASLWDRQTFLNRSFNRMTEILQESLRSRSAQLLRRFQNLFDFSESYISRVPVAEKRLAFKRGEPCAIHQVHPLQSVDVAKHLLSSKARWTLLTGVFGTGKTFAALQAAQSSKRVVIFVPCIMLSSTATQSTATTLFEEINRSLEVLDEFNDEDREVLYDISGAVLDYFLRHPDSPYTLILDGLDENHVYCKLEGLQHLNNQLVELHCHIVMTTRTNHFNQLFGNFSLAFDELAMKGRRREARLLELGPWEKEHVIELLSRAVNQTSGAERARLSEFSELFRVDGYKELYDDLPLNPLILQFILEDVAHQGVRKMNRCLLLRSCVERKIRRDRSTWVPGATSRRVSLDDSIDTEDFVGRMLGLLENVAYRMTRRVEAKRHELLESADAAVIREEAERYFHVSSDPVLAILLNSVLTAPSERRGAHFKVTFAYRLFHEYFVASFLVREGRSAAGFPDGVRALYFELKSPVPKGTEGITPLPAESVSADQISNRIYNNRRLLRRMKRPDEEIEELCALPRNQWPLELYEEAKRITAAEKRVSRSRKRQAGKETEDS